MCCLVCASEDSPLAPKTIVKINVLYGAASQKIAPGCENQHKTNVLPGFAHQKIAPWLRKPFKHQCVVWLAPQKIAPLSSESHRKTRRAVWGCALEDNHLAPKAIVKKQMLCLGLRLRR